MLCSNCKKRDAIIHFNGVINGKAVSLDLCKECAQNSGLPFSAPTSAGVTDFLGAPIYLPPASPALSELFSILSTLYSPPESALTKSCPHCRWSFGQFKKTGNLGCPSCYDYFRGELDDVIRRIHGTAAHKGKKPGSPVGKAAAKPVKARETLAQLKQKLEAAVKAEDFEKAAEFRDKIRGLEGKKS
jgi:protein arginine kinase activator